MLIETQIYNNNNNGNNSKHKTMYRCNSITKCMINALVRIALASTCQSDYLYTIFFILSKIRVKT